MKKLPSISIFFPAYNEEANIEESVFEAEKVAQKVANEYEIIVVNDGSRDRTGTIADRLSKENPRVRAVHHNPNQGYGAAVWSGIQAARYDYVFFTDSDLQFKLSELSKLAAEVPEYKVVLGYRAPRKDPFMRIFNAWGWKMLNRFFFGLKVRDIDCAFKLMKRDLFANLPVKSKGAMLSAELLIRLQRQGIKFKEIPVTHLPRTRGSQTGAKLSVIVKAFKEMWVTYQGDLGNKNILQAFKFGTVGIANTLIDWTAYLLLTRSITLFAVNLVSAKAISFLLGSIFSFFANRQWTFKVRSHVEIPELIKFYATVGAGLLINVAATYLLIYRAGLYDIASVAIATGITLFWNFTLSKFWVFKVKENQSSQNKIPQTYRRATLHN